MKAYSVLFNFLCLLLLSFMHQIKSKQDQGKKMSIIGFGSPIVDGVIKYESNPQLCEKMKKEFSYHMSENFPIEFYYEMLESSKPYLLGGSAMNTIRAVNYLLNLTNNDS